MIKQVFQNYEAFYNMGLSSTIMSNSQTIEFAEDSRKIIRFIGKAYKLKSAFIEECVCVILGELTKLGRTIDQQAVYSDRAYGDEYTDVDSLFDIKGDVLSTLQKIGKNNAGKADFDDAYEGWFDYSHYKTYQANVRFNKIEMTSASGNLIATRQVGILKSLGIGCKKDYDRAIMRLTQCAYWGDIPSMRYLCYVYSLKGDEENSKLWEEIFNLCEEYLRSGITVIPDEDKNEYSETAISTFVYISSIFQDVVHSLGVKNIDFSFIEAITSPSLDYYQKMFHINNYRSQAWKEITNSSSRPKRTLGF